MSRTKQVEVPPGTPATQGIDAPLPARKTKPSLLLGLIGGEKGATLEELTSATEWLPHTARSSRLDLPLTIPITTVRAGGEVRLLLPPSPRSGNGRHDAALIALVAKAWTARQTLTSTVGISVDEAAAGMGLKADYFQVLVRISHLAPDVVAAILGRKQPATLTRQKLARMTDLPLEWEAQRSVLGFSAELRNAA